MSLDVWSHAARVHFVRDMSVDAGFIYVSTQVGDLV